MMFFEHQGERILQRRAKLGDADRMAGETVERGEAGGIGLVRDDEAEAVEARMLDGIAADNFHAALIGEDEERVGEAGRAEIDIAAAMATTIGWADSNGTIVTSKPSSRK